AGQTFFTRYVPCFAGRGGVLPRAGPAVAGKEEKESAGRFGPSPEGRMVRRLNELIHGYAGLIRGASVALIVPAASLFPRALPAERPLQWLTEQVGELGAWGPVLFVLLYVLLTVVLLPGTPITVAAGAVFGPLVGTALISLASTTSAALSFLIGHNLAREAVA